MKAKRNSQARRRARRGLRARVRSRRCQLRCGATALGITFSAMAMLASEAHGQFGSGYGADTISSDAWAISVDSSGTLLDWYGVGDNDPQPHQLNFAQYFFQIGDDQIRPLSSLNHVNVTYSEVTNSASYFFQSYPDDDPLFNVSLTYGVQGRNRLSSAVTHDLGFTNLSGSPLDITVYGYHDLDLDDTPGDETARRLDDGRIIQSGSSGSTVNVVTSVVREPFAITGDDGYQINDILDSSSIYPMFVPMNQRMSQPQLTSHADGLLSNSGDFEEPGDAEFAFQYHLALSGTNPASEVIRTSYQGAFARILLPDPTVDPDPNDQQFVITDPTPPTKGQGPAFYDPDVAVGYDYVLDAGSGNQFAELYLPTGFGDDIYTLIITDPDHDMFGIEIEVNGYDDQALSYDLTYLGDGDEEFGITSFRILGIETDALVDPTDPYGFPTGLTFLNDNPVQLTQSAISVFVPEPTTLGLMVVGLAGLMRRRGR